MEEIFPLTDRRAKRAPDYAKTAALAHGKDILHVVWDQAGGYPQHAWGYEQWSVRPFTQMYGCDGTTDANIHYIAMKLCEAIGIDYPALYDVAYEWQEKERQKRGRSDMPGDWLRRFNWAPIAAETIVPTEPTHLAFQRLLDDLGEINNRSVVAALEDALIDKGYDTTNWWETEKPADEEVASWVRNWREAKEAS